ncbi:disease resistance protein (TIR-NBS-LRR class) [Forsythia ovata]|uniref:Disease resistance protein (TIR-NBS-LRR class) n=1 Tax=Forsythia ovata TaxID=205694 RepID=A0ABD1XC98_9LAMI
MHQDSTFDELPVIAEVEAKILRITKAVYSHALNLRGIPNTEDDQLYFCRYPDDHPLVSILEDDDKIQVVRRNPPFDPRIMLKKCGIHLVYENEDDYDGDEESLNKNLHTVSHRLTRFVNSPEEHNSNSNTTNEDGGQEGNGIHCLEFVFGILRQLLAKCFSLPQQNAVN